MRVVKTKRIGGRRIGAGGRWLGRGRGEEWQARLGRSVVWSFVFFAWSVLRWEEEARGRGQTGLKMEVSKLIQEAVCRALYLLLYLVLGN
jgi:hypothetical protein